MTGGLRDPRAEARRALRRRRRRRRIRRTAAWVLVTVAAVTLGMGIVLGWDVGLTWLRRDTSLFRVRQVDVGPTAWVPPWEAVERSGISVGDDILAIVPDSVAARLERHPRVARARVRRTWRRTVRIDLVEKPPVALWVHDGFYEVAADGTVLGRAPRVGLPRWPRASRRPPEPRGTDLPLLTGVRDVDPIPGVRLRQKGVRRALAFLVRLRHYGRGGEQWVSEVWAGDPDSLVAVTLGGVTIRIGDGRVSRRKVEALRAVLDRIRRDGAPVSYVDARFREQVIVKRG